MVLPMTGEVESARKEVRIKSMFGQNIWKSRIYGWLIDLFSKILRSWEEAVAL
jgi:hypothetical protein